MPSRLQQSRSDETRAGLLTAARKLFSAQGFAATSIDEIVGAAGVTRGALYHHFANKRDVFRAVFIQLEDEFTETSKRAVSRDADAWTNLIAGCRAYLDTCLDRDIRRILVLDGPGVLGYDDWRGIEERYALRPIRLGLVGAMDAGRIATQPSTPLARLVLAAVNEAGLYIAQSDDPIEARGEAGLALDALLGGLLVS